jgi:hypothetical protein
MKKYPFILIRGRIPNEKMFKQPNNIPLRYVVKNLCSECKEAGHGGSHL